MKEAKVLFIAQEITPYLPESEIANICRNLPQGIHGLQGALILDPPEHGLSLQLKGDPVLPQDQYGVREHRGKDQAV